MKIKISFIPLLLLLFLGLHPTFAQDGDVVFIDGQGVIRWTDSQEEVKGFGINYTLPFAHAYKTAERMGIDKQQAIDEDVYHFARMGLDLYRIHVWDTEISDTLGNLLQNEHLELFDYTIHKMKERGMKFILTPIAYWGGGWPEPDVETPGFAYKFGKAGSLTHPDAIKAQQNYLAQFIEHVNPYTGIAYKDDPDVIAFEISNEPHHPGTAEDVTNFINAMVESMRGTGTKKQIFYNMSHSIHLVDGYFNADIQGGTFQWYPTNLMAMHELQGNFLPHVDTYDIPFADHPRFREMAKIVYEFDPADVGASYIYPAMARSFRTAGMQLAAQFSYDPLFMAPYNTEYGTHFMNLAYTPQKAISLMISHAVFHDVPMYKDYGKFPENTEFEGIRVSYEEDLAIYNSAGKFYHTNHTGTGPKDISGLREIAGYGNSPIVEYTGTGAYFLDKLEDGIWRLEVMPDAAWIRDPFGPASPRKKVAVVNYQDHSMSVKLPDLGTSFNIQAMNQGNEHSTEVEQDQFTVRPGVYLLSEAGKSTADWSGDREIRNIRLSEFVAPESTLDRAYVIHEPAAQATSDTEMEVKFQVFAPEAPREVNVFVQGKKIAAEKGHGYQYSATIPSEQVQEGFLDYHILVEEEEKTTTFPSEIEGVPSDWDFYGEDHYRVAVVMENAPVHLFNASSDFDYLMKDWNRGVKLVPSHIAGAAELQVDLDSLPTYEHQGEEVRDYSVRLFVGEKIKGRKDNLDQMTKIRITGQALHDQETPVQIVLISRTGEAYGATVQLNSKDSSYEISINELENTKSVNLPRSYPDFLNYYFESPLNTPIDLNEIENIQISIGPGLSAEAYDQKQGFRLQGISLVAD